MIKSCYHIIKVENEHLPAAKLCLLGQRLVIFVLFASHCHKNKNRCMFVEERFDLYSKQIKEKLARFTTSLFVQIFSGTLQLNACKVI